MDKVTLNQLIAAYKAAPSSELAGIVTFELIRSERFSEVAEFLPNLTLNLENHQIATLAEHAPKYASALSEYTKKLKEPARHDLIAELVRYNHHDLVAELSPSKRERPSSDQENGNVTKSEKVNEDSRPKLRVIEKPDSSAIDLNKFRQKSTDFSDVVGLEKIKSQVRKKIILPYQKPSLLARFRKKVGGGVLLYGPPGCGKTLLARATAGECNAKFFNIEAADVLDMYIGESEQKLHAIFEKARQQTPCVLFFDELEALAGKREHARNNTHANIVSQFLTELDGFTQNNEGVLVLASTNVPWAVDSAFLRPGRFDRLFFVPPPDKAARLGILEHHFRDRLSDDNIDFGAIASKTSGYSGADLANLIDLAVDEAIDDSLDQDRDVPVNRDHIKAALAESRPTTLEWLTTARNYARYANDGGRYDDVLDFIKKVGK